MPSITGYLSDASMSSEDEEDEEEIEPLYTERELDYWAIEALLEKRGPPTVIEYAQNIGSVSLRECVVAPLKTDIRAVVNSLDSHSWRLFWQRRPVGSGRFSYEDWDAIGEFCYSLCECCTNDPTMDRVRSCMIRLVGHGHFKSHLLV